MSWCNQSSSVTAIAWARLSTVLQVQTRKMVCRRDLGECKEGTNLCEGNRRLVTRAVRPGPLSGQPAGRD